MPEGAYTLKAGTKSTAAGFYLHSVGCKGPSR